MARIDRFYTPQLPLSRGDSFDYEYIRDVTQLVKQNLKNILLTIPGERAMDPDFGVGVSTYLFENFGSFEGENCPKPILIDNKSWGIDSY